MQKVLLDANFLVLPFQHNVDIVAELDRIFPEAYGLYTLNRTYNEARDLEDGRYRQMVERLVDEADITVLTVDASGDVDAVLREMAGEFIICTNDGELRRRFEEHDLPHVYLRQKTHLVGENLASAASF